MLPPHGPPTMIPERVKDCSTSSSVSVLRSTRPDTGFQNHPLEELAPLPPWQHFFLCLLIPIPIILSPGKRTSTAAAWDWVQAYSSVPLPGMIVHELFTTWDCSSLCWVSKAKSVPGRSQLQKPQLLFLHLHWEKRTFSKPHSWGMGIMKI